LARRSSPAPSGRHIVEPKPKKLNPSPAFGILSHPLGEEPSPVGAPQPYRGWVLAHGHPPSKTKSVQKGSATVPVAVFGVAPKTLQPTNLSNEVSGATPEPAGGTPALPPNVHRKMNLARRSSQRDNRKLPRSSPAMRDEFRSIQTPPAI
jgi:hypothetical protein